MLSCPHFCGDSVTLKSQAKHLFLLAVAVFFLSHCGGGGAASPTQQQTGQSTPAQNPVPSITQVKPQNLVAGGNGGQITITGTNFSASSVVQWNGSSLATTFITPMMLDGAFSQTNIAQAGNAQITVLNPAPGGGESNAVTLTVLASAPSPHIDSITPSSIIAGSDTTDVTVFGSGFYSGSEFLWNGGAISRSTFISATQLQGLMNPGALAFPGQAQITVRNYPAVSNTVTVNLVPGGTSPGPINVVGIDASGAVLNRTPNDPSITANGRFVAFDAYVGPAGDQEILVRDTCRSAATGCQPSTAVVSTAADGTQGNANSQSPAISDNGRFVVFSSTATNLVPNTPAGTLARVVLHDRDVSGSGVFDQPGNTANVLISVAMDGSFATGFKASISSNGRYVGFISSDSDLVAGDTNAVADAFVRDTCIGASGCTPTTVRASVATDGSEANNGTLNAALSGNGRFIAFESQASNLAAGALSGVFLRDTCLGGGSGCVPTTQDVSVNSAGIPSPIGAFPAISADGRFVTFISAGLVGGDSTYQNVYLRDTCENAAVGCVPSTIEIPGGANGRGDGPAISPDGRFVGYQSAATNIASNNAHDTNNIEDFFVTDTCFGAPVGCVQKTVQVSMANDGTQSSADSGLGIEVPNIRLSSTLATGGPAVVFFSTADNLVPNVNSNYSGNIFYVATTLP